MRLEGRSFALKSGEPVRFDLVATTSGTVAAGEQVDLADHEHSAAAAAGHRAAAVSRPARQEIAVHLASTLTEVGTLELHCIADDDPAQRWRLEFQLRGDSAATAMQALPPRFGEAVALIERVFGTRDRHADPKAVKQLRTQLEAMFGQRERWNLGLLQSAVRCTARSAHVADAAPQLTSGCG